MNATTSNQERPLARLIIPAEPGSLPAISALVRHLAARQGLDTRSVERLAFAVDEACAHVIDHAYPPDSPGNIEVSLFRRPGRLVVAVEDQGLPFDFEDLADEEHSAVGRMLAAFDGHVHYLSLGRRGNRVELVKDLPPAPPPDDVAREEVARGAAAVPAPADAPLIIRLMKPEEAMALVRCVYRSYGYSYDCDYMYEPDKVRARQEAGLMRSAVAVVSDGEIVGHLALNVDRPDARVGEAAQAVVDPRYRGHGLFERLKTFLKEDARARGLYGVYSEAVTVHPYSQKGNLHLGARETGLLLGYIPASVSYKQIKELQQQRQSVMLFYLKVNDGPERTLHAPANHAAALRRLCDAGGLKRQVAAEANGPPADLVPDSQLDVTVRTDHNEAFLRVRTFGADLTDLVRFRLRELFLRRVDCVYLDLPLAHPATAHFGPRLESAGFFFGGIIPEMADGDVLRLQCLNNVAIDPAQIQVASDHGRELLDYVLKAKAAAPQVLFN